MPTLAQLFAEGYQIGESIPRLARARAAAKEQYGAAAEDPELFSSLQQMEYRKNADARANQAETRAQSGERRAQGTYDFNMGQAKNDQKRESALRVVQAMRAARDSGEDLATTFDKITPMLKNMGVDPSDFPQLKQQVIENPDLLDSYYTALNDGKPVSASAQKAATKAAADAVSADRVVGDVVKRIDRLADPKRENAGRSVFGLPTPGKVLQGGAGMYASVPATVASDYVNDLEALKADIRSAAFETLKGGGQITEKESEFAANAIARLERSMSWEQYQRELTDLKSYMTDLRAAAIARASGKDVNDVVPADQRTPAQVNQNAARVSQIYPGWVNPKTNMRFKGGEVRNPDNWEPAN